MASTDEIKACVKVAACVCGEDGVISEVEELKLLELVGNRFPERDTKLFDQALEEYFESDRRIEDLFDTVTDPQLRRFILEIAEVSAAADGLDPRENIALNRFYDNWGISRDA